jgi:hypothetical protein
MENEREIDLDSLLEEFENEWEEESNDSDVTDDAEVGNDEVGEPNDSEIDDSEQVDETETTNPNPNDEDADRRNRAFADLRRQADENKKYAEFISRLAQDSGVTPDEILNRYEERRLEERAEQDGVPVEHLRKLNDTEGRLSQLEEQLFAERLNSQVESVIAKHGNDENLIRSTFEYMAQAGIDPRVQQVDFEKLYRAANLDTIIQKEVANARQADLANKKKRQDGASIANGSSVSPPSGDLSDEEVDSILAKFDIRI